MITALTLSGSIRKGSHNEHLQALMGERLKAAGVEVEAISLKNFEMPIFNQDLEPDNIPQSAVALAKLFTSHDIVFIATPEYNGGLPPLLVNTITWLSRVEPWPFARAVFGIGGVSSGKYGTIWAQSHLRDSLTKIGTLVVPTLLGIGPASKAFTEDGRIAERAIDKKMDRMVAELTHFSRGGL